MLKKLFVEPLTSIDFVAFISMLFIGADVIGINIGINLRLDQIFLSVLTILILLKDELKIKENKPMVLFGIFSLVSTILAYNKTRGILFFASIIFNIVFVYYSIRNYTRISGLEKTINVFRLSCYTMFFILVIQVILELVFHKEISILPFYGYYLGVPRFSLWFYEPSYMATFLIFWLSFALYNALINDEHQYWIDTFFCLIMLVISTSSSGFIGIALVIIVIYVIWIMKNVTFWKLLFPLLVIIALVTFVFVFPSVFNVFILRLFNGNLDSTSGGRISGWITTCDVFIKNPLFGVGPGNYGLYLVNDTSVVPTNVTLDLMATVGIFATLSFYGIMISSCLEISILNKRHWHSYESDMLKSLKIGIIIFTIILQFNQGYLRLYHWMFFAIIDGGLDCFFANFAKEKETK